MPLRLLAAGASVFDFCHWHDLIPCLEDVIPLRAVAVRASGFLFLPPARSDPLSGGRYASAATPYGQ